MYQDAFAIDEILFTERKKTQHQVPNYFLNNYNYYLPKLEKEFYLKYFLRELLFDLDIVEVDEFLDNQYANSKNQGQFIKIITLKVIPAIDNIINNAQTSMSEGGYYEEIKLEDGFIETEGVVKNEKYELRMFYHLTSLQNLEEDLLYRKKLIVDYLARINALTDNENTNLLKWRGKPAHLAFIISQLIDKRFIDAPIKTNGEINYTELSKQILTSFKLDSNPKIDTLRKYANPDDEKYQSLLGTFDDKSFKIPFV
jgi:hypothetical protein